ncbi:phage major capsid protein [Methylorubrum rhodesianum]|uniref:phage major capsid protein n=1 Tax=Methylorubrum rhodesianum TaxID=29427 RepID=UPI003D07873D
MNMHTPPGIRAAREAGKILRTKDAAGLDGLMRAVEDNHKAVDARLKSIETSGEKSGQTIDVLDARMVEIEQKMARRGGGGSPEMPKTWGQTLIESDEFKSLAGSQDQRGRARVAVETKTVFSSTASGGALIAPDTSQVGNPVMMPRKRLVIRDLVAPGQTSGNTVHWSRQKTRTMNAAGVAEGTRKPESDITWEPMQSPVVTIAHYIKAARQTLDDAPALMSIIDSEMRYGLADKEDSQFLFGDGTGQNLLGLMGQAAPFAPPFSNPAGDSAIDRLLQAIAQSEQALLPATGIVLNVVDWLKLIGFKDGNGRYLSAGPFGPGNQRLLWDLPIAATTQMPQGQFLVGAFRDGAQIFDRMQATVLVATENEDDFVRNLITVLCEERLAFAVKRPDAFVKGTLEAE